MTEPTVREGGCRCGKVRFRTTAPEIATMACHCTGCQHMTASAFSLSALFPAQAFEVSGETALGGLHGSFHHHYCAWCLSWVYTTADMMGDMVNVRATLFDDTSWYEPFVETWTDERLPWISLPAKFSFPGFPPMERMPELIEAYAARR